MAQLGAAVSEQRASANAGHDEVSLVRGGPFYRAQEALRLVHPDRWNLGRRIVFAIAIGWLPLVLITLLFNPRAVFGLITDYTVNARMLFGVPVLLAGQPVMETAFRAIVRHIRDAALLTPTDTDRLDQTLVRLIRLRDSIIPELMFVVVAYAKVAETVQTQLMYVRPWGLAGTGLEAHLSAAGWYYVLVSQLLYGLLILISFWKWLLWCIFLYRLSKLDLQLVPTHPDQHGGIGFLGLSPVAITPHHPGCLRRDRGHLALRDLPRTRAFHELQDRRDRPGRRRANRSVGTVSPVCPQAHPPAPPWNLRVRSPWAAGEYAIS